MSLITKVYEPEPWSGVGPKPGEQVYPTPDHAAAMDALADGKSLHEICLVGGLQPDEARFLAWQCDLLTSQALPTLMAKPETTPADAPALKTQVTDWFGPTFPAQKFVDLAVDNCGGTYTDLVRVVRGEKPVVIRPKPMKDPEEIPEG